MNRARTSLEELQRPASAADEVLLLGMSRQTAALIVMFLVAMDAWSTTVWLRTGFGFELNPLMAWLVDEVGDFFFLVIKLLATGLCMLWVVHRASFAHARIAAYSAFAIYGGVDALHIYNGLAYLPG